MFLVGLAKVNPRGWGVVEGKRGEMRETALVLESHHSRSRRCALIISHTAQGKQCNPAYKFMMSKSFGLFATALPYQAHCKSYLDCGSSGRGI